MDKAFVIDITVSLQSGPDIHYKVFQTVSETPKRYEEEGGKHDITVFGYRNFWYRFHLDESNFYMFVSLNMFYPKRKPGSSVTKTMAHSLSLPRRFMWSSIR